MNYKRTPSLNIVLLTLVIMLLGISCKENKKQIEESPVVVKVETVKSLAPVYKEIAEFMDLKVSDSTEIESILSFKAITGNDSILSSDAEQNLKFYKGIMKNGKSASMPIFEAKESGLCLLLLTGKGYVGSLWTKVLIDKNTAKTVKVRFGHKMESEGYGDGIVSSAFGDQFNDQLISSEGNTFGLTQSGKPVIEGNAVVDGVSGATVTSSAVVQMLNDGLKKYLDTK